ncbi:MAG: hypothetical protein K6F94_01690 [Bacteroidaceae bacterium]|nr:hypothetical protein [Bacteroidaceae bacterium]
MKKNYSTPTLHVVPLSAHNMLAASEDYKVNDFQSHETEDLGDYPG